MKDFDTIAENISGSLYGDKSIKLTAGDADEFYMNAYDGDDRYFVWAQYKVDPNTSEEKLIARFKEWADAEKYLSTLSEELTKRNFKVRVI